MFVYLLPQHVVLSSPIAKIGKGLDVGHTFAVLVPFGWGNLNIELLIRKLVLLQKPGQLVADQGSTLADQTCVLEEDLEVSSWSRQELKNRNHGVPDSIDGDALLCRAPSIGPHKQLRLFPIEAAQFLSSNIEKNEAIFLQIVGVSFLAQSVFLQNIFDFSRLARML